MDDEKSDVAEAIESLAYWVKDLGNAGALTQMGAIENLSLQVSRIADALSHMADIMERWER